MTQFVPKDLDEKNNVNITKTSHLHEFAVLLAGLGCIVVVIYVLMGFAVNVMITRMPDRIEKIVTSLMDLKTIETPDEWQVQRQRIQSIVDELAKSSLELAHRPFTIQILESKEVNAFALPGGKIVILSGLLDEVESENELVMILGHELGHFQNNDHLQAMGRGLVVIVSSSLLLGTNSSVTGFFNNIFMSMDLKFSRQQELAADKIGLQMLNQKFGHVGGAEDFFKRAAQEEGLEKYLQFRSTHPQNDLRVDQINEMIDQMKYHREEKVPFENLDD